MRPAVCPDAVIAIFDLQQLALRRLRTTNESRALPALNDSACPIVLPATDGLQAILPVSSRAPVSLRVTGSENVNSFPATGFAGTPTGFPSSGRTSSGGVTGVCGVTGGVTGGGSCGGGGDASTELSPPPGTDCSTASMKDGLASHAASSRRAGVHGCDLGVGVLPRPWSTVCSRRGSRARQGAIAARIARA